MSSILARSVRLSCNILPKHITTRVMSVVTLSDQDAVSKFTTINNKSIVYFTATWCPPCKIISPVYNDLSIKYADEIAFGKVDVDENDTAAINFNIRAVPTFVFFDGQNVHDRFSGADADQLDQLITALKDL